ncbi:MAG: glutathione-disulfide reductase [Cyanobacteria bacterium J06598_3]
MAKHFDLFVIGGGSGGMSAAKKAAAYGATVAIAERDRLGGTCVNRGCVPKKLMVYASRFPRQAADASGYGWQVTPGVFDWKTLMQGVTGELRRLNDSFLRTLEASGVQLYRSHAKLVDEHTILVGDEQITAERILLAVGGAPVKPDIPGMEHALTSNEMFTLAEQPKQLVILGGGYIGCEFASMMHGLGSAVTIVIRDEKILSGFDDDLRSLLHDSMEKQGIKIINQAKMRALEKTTDGVTVTIEAGDEQVIKTDVVNLAATGRKPQLENLGVGNTQVVITEKGVIETDQHHQTAEPSIYAIGDCTDHLNLTPVATAEGATLATTLYGQQPQTMSYETIPTAAFTTPEVASVGMTEQQAIDKYGKADVKIFQSRFCPMYNSLPNKNVRALTKLVVHKPSDRVLGAHMLGDHAAEIMQGMAIALKLGATQADFLATVGIHPSSAEEFVCF